MAKIKIPTRFLRMAPQRKTVAIRGKGGRFTGRKPVSGTGDTTRSRYLIHDTDFNRDGRIGPSEHGGTIHGRTVRVKASGRAKGYERRV